jgi:ribosome-interacting GTPase 1
VCLIGFPSVGKSTLLSKTTKTESSVGAYEFTTLTVSRGVVTLTDSILRMGEHSESETRSFASLRALGMQTISTGTTAFAA